MNELLVGASPALGLAFLLGLRHGLDPDHIAVINTLTLRGAAEQRPWAPWTGSYFALGHGLSVVLVAVAVSWLAREVQWPVWLPAAIDAVVVTVLLAVGITNLRHLYAASSEMAPTSHFVRWLRLDRASGPAAIIAVGAVFGMVMGTSSQAAAWGLAGSGTIGAFGGLLLALTFGAGMLLVDTLDSQLLMRLHRESAGPALARRYYRGVRWMIVGMSFGMAAYTGLGLVIGGEVPEGFLTAVGFAGAMAVLLLLFQAKRAAEPVMPVAVSSVRETP